MAHEHSVIDTDLRFVIDPKTREIKNNSGKVKIMQYDHQSERVTFEIPRLVDDHDMSVCNRVEVHYLNVGTGVKNAGIYPVTDLQVGSDKPDVVTGSWLITANATQLVGQLNFVLRFACVTDGIVDYAWHTEVYSGIKITGSIYNSDVVVEEYADVIADWESRILRLEDLVSAGGGGSGSGSVAEFKIGDGLKLLNGTLTVDTAEVVEEDNTKPVTSAAVYTELGNISVLLGTI